jgi:uncharacterized damage-inducible protein DinB
MEQIRDRILTINLTGRRRPAMTTSLDENPGEEQARRLERVLEQLTALLKRPEAARRLHRAPGEHEWSAMQVLGHVVEMIPYWMGHCHGLIAATEPPRFGRTPDAPGRLAGVARGAAAEPDELLRWLQEEVQAAARWIRQLSGADRGKKGLHIKRGEMRVGDIVELFIVAHAEEHVVQVRAALGN